MKLFPCLLSRSAFIAPILITTISIVDAQEVVRSTGGNEEVSVTAAPMRLIATLTPDDAGSEVTGGICFGPAGDGLEVSGQLNGLDPNKRYQLRVIMSERAVPEATNIRPDDSINKENPLPPRPAGEDRNLGILLSDASGGIVINVALNGVSLAKGDQIVLGKTLTLTEIPAEGASGAPVRIATATVKMPESEKAPTQPSRLDDLGPGERWF